ncbi:Ig-like domain-containing protein [Litorisediminicola beolgyonensis]|uniref:Ig-like domain-containing protein n=1 Tax=Litorisediminicola beolgyonensis TaxID=1173614 RepID=A0ABW3ZJC6_9RHOB
MDRSITFQISGLDDIRITVTELDDGSLLIDVVNTAGGALDLRALYFDLTGAETLTDGLSLSGDDVTAYKLGDGDITNVGSGTTISGIVVNEFGAFDVGAALDTGGLSSTSFILSHDTLSLDLDMLSLADFAVRAEGGEPKLGDTSTLALLAADDAWEIDENTTSGLGNLLANDRQSSGLHVSQLAAGGAALPVGSWAQMVTEGGRTGSVLVDATGALHFDAATGFDDLNLGQTDHITLQYSTTDANGSRDWATVTLTVTGINDGPHVAAPLVAITDEDAAAQTIDLLAGAVDVDAGAVLTTQSLVETSGQGGWSAQGDTVTIDPAYFNALAEGQTAELVFAYEVADEHGATVPQTLTVTVEGRNDEPTVAAALARRVSEEDAAFAVDLLEGAADVDTGATLSALGLVETGGQGGWTLDGDRIVIDPNYFDDLNDGDLGTLRFAYKVSDEFGAMVDQTLTIEVEGYTDAPLIEVEVRAAQDGAGANVVELVVTTEQARDEAIALRFSGIPQGARLLDASGQDAAPGVADALGVTIYRLELPLGTDVPDITVTVVGLEPDGTEIGTRDAVVALGYDATTTTNPLAFFADDVDLWGSGDEFSYSVSEYIPLLGGGRIYYELVGAASQSGQVFLDRDEIKWIPDGTYDGLSVGQTATEIVSFTYRKMIEDADGTLVSDPAAPELTETFEVTVTGGVFGPEFSGERVKMRDEAVILDPLRTLDVLDSPLSTGLLELVDVDFNSDDMFASVIDPLEAARDAFAAELVKEEQKLARAQADVDAAAERFDLLTQLTGDRAEVLLRQVAYDAAAAAADALDGALSFLEDAVDAAQSVLNTARSELSSANRAVSSAKAAYDASVTTIFGVKVGDPIKWSAYKGALTLKEGAQFAVNLAIKGLDLAEDALEEARADLSAGFLEQQEINARNALNAAKADMAATEAALETAGYYPDASALNTGDLALELAEATGELTLAQGEVLLYEGTTFGLTVLRDAAQGAVDLAEGIIATTDFRAQLYAAVEAYAQAGFQFDFAISGGSIDAQVDYDMTTISGYNAATDVLSIEVALQNMTTGEDVAFSTASPNVQIYAGLLYDMGANFEFMADFFAAIAGSVLADLSPNSDGLRITPSPNIQGALDFIDFDSRDGAEIEFGVSSGGDISPDFLTFSVGIPSIETLGRAEEPTTQYYEEGSLIALDFGELLGSFQNLLEARIELSPEVKALLNQAGVDPADPAGGQFIEAFVQALGVVFASATGAGDLDGDGTVPLFILDGTDDTAGALLHINAFPDDLSGINEETLGQFGFFTAYGESDSFVKVTLDVDQLVATLINRASANPTQVVLNPFDLELDFDDFFSTSEASEEETGAIVEWFDLDLNAELADLDVSAEFNFNQQFTMAVDEFDFIFTMEDGTEFTQTAGAPMLNIEKASQYDANGDGRIDYSLGITPRAEFFNDTEVGLGFTYMLDLIKTSLNAGINIPLEKIFGSSVGILGLEADTLEFDFFNSAVGPVFRVQGDVDAATLDVFEKRFAIDLGETSVELSAEGVAPFDLPETDVLLLA